MSGPDSLPRHPPSTLTLPNDIEYHDPHTSTSLYLRRSLLPISIPYSVLRSIISRALAEVEAIIDVAGDGTLPGSDHEYRKKQRIVDGYEIQDIEMVVKSTKLAGPADDLMTYGILHDALKGLWDVIVVAKREPKINEFGIKHGAKGIVGLGYFIWQQESPGSSAMNNLPASQVMPRSTENSLSSGGLIKLPSARLNLGTPFSYHIPHTSTTLHLERGRSLPFLYPTLRTLLSRCLTEVESIVDIAGDGVIPGPQHEYHKAQRAVDEYGWEKVDLTVVTSDPTGPPDHLMTYLILLDTLRGLWDVLITSKQEINLHFPFRIEHGDKGIIGSGFFEIE